MKRLLCAIFVIGSVASIAAYGNDKADSLATGLTTCWDTAGSQIPCTGTQQDGELQKGIPRSYTDNFDGTITDNATGLVWEKLLNGDPASVHYFGHAYVWADAFAKIAALNTEPCFVGHCDWRLPNINELLTLVDYGRAQPAIDPAFNSGDSFTLQPYVYWSSTTSITSLTSSHDTSEAWSVYFDSGFTLVTCKTCGAAVRAVRDAKGKPH